MGHKGEKMPVKLNTEFNYCYQVIGETIWEKIKTLKGFLEGRIRASVLEKVSDLKYQAQIEKLKWLKETGAPLHEQLELEATIIEVESFRVTQAEAYELNRQEIETLKKLLVEAYEIAEPTRIEGYTDEQMFEANAANEFTVMIGKEIHAELIANGRPSPAKIRNAMSNPITWNALIGAGLIPAGNEILCHNDDPQNVKLSLPDMPQPTDNLRLIKRGAE